MNAAENPFRVSRFHALPFHWPKDLDAAGLTRRWETLGHIGTLVAPHGHGKSTLLREFSSHLREQGWNIQGLTLTEEHPGLPAGFELSKSPRTLALLDGAEQLGFFEWKRWQHATRFAEGRIITQHKSGRFPTLLHLHTDVILLRHLLEELLEDDLSQLPETPESLFARHNGNLREVFRTLYDLWALK